MSTLIDYAIHELYLSELASQDETEESKLQINELVLKILRLCEDQAYPLSSLKAAYQLIQYKPLTPLTGEDDEWNQIGPHIYQNLRHCSVFKDSPEGQAYDIDHPNVKGRFPIVFPYEIK